MERGAQRGSYGDRAHPDRTLYVCPGGRRRNRSLATSKLQMLCTFNFYALVSHRAIAVCRAPCDSVRATGVQETAGDAVWMPLGAHMGVRRQCH